MKDSISRVIDNYITRYQSMMHFLYGEPMDTSRSRLGVLDNYTPIKKKKKHEFSANSLIKLLYFSAYIGVDGKNTTKMIMNIDEQPCELVFTISKQTQAANAVQIKTPGEPNA